MINYSCQSRERGFLKVEGKERMLQWQFREEASALSFNENPSLLTDLLKLKMIPPTGSLNTTCINIIIKQVQGFIK